MPSYKPVFSQIVDPIGIAADVRPRAMTRTTDESRAQTVQTTGGEPLVDFGGTSNPYIDYQSIDLLLSLQHPRSDGYDEMCFFVMGQVKELLFRGLHFELANAQIQIRDSEIGNALIILQRAKTFVEYITRSWDVLSTITPEGFNQFRDHLGTASGQLSFMYRHIEFILGNKSRKLALAHRNVPHIWPAIKQALESPSLYDDTIRLLKRNGLPIESSALERDWSAPYEPNKSVEDAWLDVYRHGPGPDNHLYQLAETLVSIDDQMSQYRWRHFVSVHRIIGYKAGTGGSAGVEWLEHVTSLRFFPELWSVRTRL